MNQTDKKPTGMHFPLISWILLIVLILSGCNLIGPDLEDDVKVNISSSSMSDGESITVRIINSTPTDIQVFENNLQSNLQKRIGDGDWGRLPTVISEPGESIIYIDWYTNIEANSFFEQMVSHESIERLIDISKLHTEVQGEYRVIYEVVFDHDYLNKAIYTSTSFFVE